MLSLVEHEKSFITSGPGGILLLQETASVHTRKVAMKTMRKYD